MDKNTVISIGAIISIIGFILFLYGVTSYNQLQESYNGYPYYIMPYPPKYEQEKTNYSFIGIIGVVLIISGIFIAKKYTKRIKQNKRYIALNVVLNLNTKLTFIKVVGIN